MSINLNIKSPIPPVPPLGAIKSNSPFFWEDDSKLAKFGIPAARPRVPSNARCTALGWSKHSTGKNDNKENTSQGLIMTRPSLCGSTVPSPKHDRCLVLHDLSVSSFHISHNIYIASCLCAGCWLGRTRLESYAMPTVLCSHILHLSMPSSRWFRHCIVKHLGLPAVGHLYTNVLRLSGGYPASSSLLSI